MAKHKTRKYISLNNLESKHSLLLKFDQFMSYYKRKKFIKKFYKKCNLKTVCKELGTTFIEKWKFWIKVPVLDI